MQWKLSGPKLRAGRNPITLRAGAEKPTRTAGDVQLYDLIGLFGKLLAQLVELRKIAIADPKLSRTVGAMVDADSHADGS